MKEGYWKQYNDAATEIEELNQLSTTEECENQVEMANKTTRAECVKAK